MNRPRLLFRQLLAVTVQTIITLGFAGHLAHAQTLPAPWASTDIGAPALNGSASFSNGVFSVDAAGTDIWDASDQFHFVYQQVTGDVDIIARVQNVTNQHAWSKGGVMIRASLAANAAHALALASAGKGVHFQRRASTGAQSASTIASSTKAPPAWVRAIRRGTTVTTSWSSDGTSWTTIGSVTLPLGTSAYVGLAFTSHNTSARTTATVTNVSVTRQGLPSGQSTADIGSPAVAGSVTHAGGVYTIKAAGTDIWDRADQFRFVYQPMTGDGELVARVASITRAHAWSKAGVMIREALTAESRHATVFASAGKGYAFQRRPETGAFSEHTAGASTAPPGWVRLVRSGDLFQAYQSSNGASWTLIGTDTIPMGDTVYAGLAVTSHNASSTTTAVVDNLRITATGGGGSNRAPAVSLTSPTSGSTFARPATITLTANATDPENRVAAVDFYVGSTVVGRDVSAPYSVTWSPSASGTYVLTAVAHDADGGSATSSGVSVTVTSSSAPRSVAFTASSNHSTAVTSYRLDIFASGANPSTATPVASSDLGKPAPASNNDITVDRASVFSALAPGNYLATVSAIGPGGTTRSATVTFSR